MNTNRTTAVVWLLFIALLVAFPAVGMFVLPATLLWISGGFRALDLFTRAIYCIFFGISCWTFLPWLTRYIPISLSSLIWVVVLALAGLLVFLGLRGNKGLPRRQTRGLDKGTWLLLAVVTAVIVLARLLPTINAIVPPGPDMSMHAYNARLIIDSDSIPRTHRPLLPIDSFGEYPIGFSVLIACTSLTSELEVQTSAMLWTCLTYILLAFGLFLLLRVWFNPAVSLCTAALATFLAASPQIYSEGGGNPTVLSFAFILAALGLFFRLSRDHSFLGLLVQSSLWGAALLTHSIPFLGATYFLVAFCLCFSLYAVATSRLGRLKAYAGRGFLVFLIALLLVGPFLAGFSPEVSEGEVQWCKSWQRDEGHSWNGTIQDSLRTIPLYIRFTFKNPFVYIILLGMFISTLSWKMRLSVFLSSLVPIGLVVNSQYWILPFSYALYPERMAMMLLAPMSVICAGLVDKLMDFTAKSKLGLTQSSKALVRYRVSRVLPLACAFLAVIVVSLRVASKLLDTQWLGALRFRHVLPLVSALLLFQLWSFARKRKLAVAAVGLSVVGMAVVLVAGLSWDYYNQFSL